MTKDCLKCHFLQERLCSIDYRIMLVTFCSQCYSFQSESVDILEQKDKKKDIKTLTKRFFFLLHVTVFVIISRLVWRWMCCLFFLNVVLYTCSRPLLKTKTLLPSNRRKRNVSKSFDWKLYGEQAKKKQTLASSTTVPSQQSSTTIGIAL